MAGEFRSTSFPSSTPRASQRFDQARREIATRFTSRALAEIGQDALTIHTDSGPGQGHPRPVEPKAIRRSLSLKIFDWVPSSPPGMTVRQRVELRRGLGDDLARKVAKLIRDEFPKVKSQVQGDAVRVSAKSKDDLSGDHRLRELTARPLQFRTTDRGWKAAV
jgi:hypothetical protein